MSLTIDYFTMPPKSQEVSQIQSVEQTKLDHENQEIAAQFQNQLKHNSDTTIRRKNVENDELKNDEKNKKNSKNNKKQHSNSKSEGDKKKSENKTFGKSSFDIRI